MGDNNKNFSRKIALFIFLPLLMNLFCIKQLNINIAYFIVLIQFIIFVSSIHQIRIKINKGQGLILLLLFLLFIIAIFSSLFSSLQIESLKTTILVFTNSIFLFLLTISDNKPDMTLKKIAKIQLSIGMFLSIIAIILFFFGQFLSISGRSAQAIIIGPIKIYQIVMGVPPYYRVASLTTNPNTLGIILMLSQISTLYLFKIRLITKIKFISLYSLLTVALILTQSRGAIITALIMVIIFSVLTSKSQISRVKIFIISLILIIVGINIITSGYFDIFSRFKSGLSNRDLPWQILLNEINRNPLVGLGFGVSSKVALYNLGIKAHNIFLNSLSEIGIIGFVIFLSIWFIGIISSFMGIRKNKDKREIKSTYAFVFSILFALIFHQMVENKLLVYDYVMFIWVYLISISILKLTTNK